MPRLRSPERDQAKELYIKHKGEIQLTDIADQLHLSEGTVRGWKAKDNWEAAVKGTLRTAPKKSTKRSDKNTERSKQSKGNHTSNISKEKPVENDDDLDNDKTNTPSPFARPGNQNAAGNRGGPGGPVRNKHALKTGEYETVFFEAIIDDGERAMLEADYDKYVMQYLLIDTLTIREKRIMVRISEVKQSAEKTKGTVVESSTVTNGTQTTTFVNRDKEGKEWPGNDMTISQSNTSHVAKPVIKRIMELEDALTRVQARKQAAIAQLHRMEMDDVHLSLDMKRFEIYKQRISGRIDLDSILDGDDDDMLLELE